MEDTLDERLEAGASEGLEYLRTALRTGNIDPELLKAARFLVEVHLAHNHMHGGEEEEYTFTTDDEEETEG